MTDAQLLTALAQIRDALVVAIADVERGDHLRAAEAIDKASDELADTIRELAA